MKGATPSFAAALLAAGLVLACLPGASAQIGASTDVWIRCYGPPRSAGGDGDVQTLAFEQDRMGIVFYGRHGIGLRAVYRKKGFAARDVRRLLDMNGESAEWTEWLPPGRAELDSTSTRWRRSDNQAMAVLIGDVLTVTGAGWTSEPPPVQAASEVTPASTPRPVVRPVSAAPSPPKPKMGTPSVLPKPGDSRARILAVLGGPVGHMLSGKAEIWVYAWGHILLNNGLFVGVDDPVFVP